jgi:Mrp family chromosome partitioning ATPase
VLAFTHAGDFEESTSMLAELATAMSRRIPGELIIVDADFHHPYLGQFLGIEADRSVVDVLWEAADWQEVVRWTKSARVSILPGGHSPRTWQPSETARLAQLLDELRSHYDLILLQAASVGHPEVAVLARHSDATYLTIQLGRVSRRQVRQAASALQRSGAALLGGIILD